MSSEKSITCGLSRYSYISINLLVQHVEKLAKQYDEEYDIEFTKEALKHFPKRTKWYQFGNNRKTDQDCVDAANNCHWSVNIRVLFGDNFRMVMDKRIRCDNDLKRLKELRILFSRSSDVYLSVDDANLIDKYANVEKVVDNITRTVDNNQGI